MTMHNVLYNLWLNRHSSAQSTLPFRVAMATDLAKAWEAQEAIRLRARRCGAATCLLWGSGDSPCTVSGCNFLTFRPRQSKVIVGGNIITRDALTQNEAVLKEAINHLGSRVGVDVNYLHLKSLYDFMKVPIDGAQAAYALLHPGSLHDH